MSKCNGLDPRFQHEDIVQLESQLNVLEGDDSISYLIAFKKQCVSHRIVCAQNKVSALSEKYSSVVIALLALIEELKKEKNHVDYDEWVSRDGDF